uniref:Uncharacterized protein n=1 Tax=Clytia hemisphaerica TaxID=252671 RepID=A0A7M5XK23_9CNID
MNGMSSSSSCYTLNLIRSNEVTDNLDKYVVLTFILTLLLSVVVVMALVKYITYNMQLDVERQRKIANRKVLPVRLGDEENEGSESDSEELFDEEWNNSGIERDDNEVEEGETCSIASTLQTNYVEAEHVSLDHKDELSDHKIIDLDVSWLISSLNLPQSFISPQHPSVITQLFSNQQHSIVVSNLVQHEQLLYQLAIIRKLGSLQLINFTIDVLLHQRVLHQELALQMRAKYEQQFDSFDCEQTESLFSASKQITLVLQNFIKDLQMLSVERKVLEELISLLFSHPLSCLKIFLLALPDHCCVKDGETTISSIAFVERLLFAIKGRYLVFKNAVNNANKTTNEVLASFDQNMIQILQHFQKEFHKIIRTQIFKINPQHLEMQLEKNVNTLKVDLLNSAGNVSKKLTNFSDSLMGLLISHLENHAVSVNQSKVQQVDKMKNLLTELQQRTISEIQKVEEACLNTLQHDCGFSDQQIEQVVGETRNSLKELIHGYSNSMKSSEKSFLARRERTAKLTNFCIDYLVKLVSSRYRTVLSSNISFVKSFPSLSDGVRSKLETSIRGKMGMVSFDVVLAIIKHTLVEMQNVKHNFLLRIPSSSFDMMSNRTEVINLSVLKHLESDFELPHTLLDALHEKCHLMINQAFQHLQQNLQQVVQQEVTKSTNFIFNENQVIFRTFHEKSRVSKVNKKKNAQYLSRKGSSSKEKAIGGKLLDLYRGAIEVRDHRYQEKVQEIEEEHDGSKSTKKGRGKCVRCFDQQQELLQRKAMEDQKFSAFFKLDQYYMREMLLKKMTNIDGKTTDFESPHDEDDRKSMAKKTKSPKKLSAKIPTRRKSRRVSDMT